MYRGTARVYTEAQGALLESSFLFPNSSTGDRPRSNFLGVQLGGLNFKYYDIKYKGIPQGIKC